MKYLYRDHFKAYVSTIKVHGAFGDVARQGNKKTERKPTYKAYYHNTKNIRKHSVSSFIVRTIIIRLIIVKKGDNDTVRSSVISNQKPKLFCGTWSHDTTWLMLQ